MRPEACDRQGWVAIEGPDALCIRELPEGRL
jgi:hypothetical protein